MSSLASGQPGSAPRLPPVDVGWPTCSEADCVGRRLPEAGSCLAHADRKQQMAAYRHLSRGRPVDVAAGVAFTEELLAELRAHLPRTDDGRVMLRHADFRRAVLPGLPLERAWFTGRASFSGARLASGAMFHSTQFDDYAEFSDVRFDGFASFPETVFKGNVSFQQARFAGGVQFHDTRFDGNVWFDKAQFGRDADLHQVRFRRNADFHEARFEGDVALRVTQAQGDLRFNRAVFARPPVGPVAVAGCLALDEVVFDEPVQLHVAAWRLSCRGTRFKAGGHLRVSWAEIALDDAEISAPLILSADAPAPRLIEIQRVPWLVDPHAMDPDRRFPPPVPSLISVQRADVAHLELTDVDLADCRFAGAHHLDQLTIATADAFHRAPSRWGAGRQVLAEEILWRSLRGGRRAHVWRQVAGVEFQSRSPLVRDARQPGPSELAGIYRQLRKGREDAKNEPGAADFYYGECEMRRHAQSTPRAETLLLTLYWLTSGYALRAWRALACLTVLLAIVTALLTVYGLPDASAVAGAGAPPAQTEPAGAWPMPTSATGERVTLPRVGAAAWSAVNGAVFRSAGVQLTPAGRAVELADRVLGPVLLGLALLSIRNRVKR